MRRRSSAGRWCFDDPQRPLEARILWRPRSPAGTEIDGPAVIEEPNSTTLIARATARR